MSNILVPQDIALCGDLAIDSARPLLFGKECHGSHQEIKLTKKLSWALLGDQNYPRAFNLSVLVVI